MPPVAITPLNKQEEEGAVVLWERGCRKFVQDNVRVKFGTLEKVTFTIRCDNGLES